MSIETCEINRSDLSGLSGYYLSAQEHLCCGSTPDLYVDDSKTIIGGRVTLVGTDQFYIPQGLFTGLFPDDVNEARRRAQYYPSMMMGKVAGRIGRIVLRLPGISLRTCHTLSDPIAAGILVGSDESTFIKAPDSVLTHYMWEAVQCHFDLHLRNRGSGYPGRKSSFGT